MVHENTMDSMEMIINNGKNNGVKLFRKQMQLHLNDCMEQPMKCV